jgi:NAD-dependent SIR2 family protein deacetylase
MSDVEREQRIKRRAYEIWEAEGKPESCEEKHYARATDFVESEMAAGATMQITAPRIPAALRAAVRQRQAVLFAGAGISAGVLGLAGGSIRDAVANRIREDFKEYDLKPRRLEDVCDEYQAISDRNSLVSFLAAHVPINRPPSEGHVAAVNLFPCIITTNWDLLFEEAYRKLRKEYRLLVEDRDAPNFSYEHANLLKIHGSVDRPRSLICTTEDYETYPETHPQLLDKVASLLTENTILFVGYGLGDEHVRALLSRIRRTRGALGSASLCRREV